MDQHELFRSFADTWRDLDSVEAFDHGLNDTRPILQSFERDRLRRHAAAFRSLAGAIEALDLESLDDEIDRAILLAAVRTRLHRLDHDHAERTDPVLWTSRLARVIESGPGSDESLAAIPDWVEAARLSLSKAPIFHLQVALDLVAETRQRLAGESWWMADKERLSAANAALDRLERFLRHEIEPDPRPTAGSLGEAEVEWRLHHAFLLELSAGEATRRLTRLAEEAAAAADRVSPPEADHPPVWAVHPGAAAAIGTHRSEIRRSLVPPAWGRGWLTFAAGLPSAGPESVRAAAALLADRQARIAGLDLALQLGLVAPGDAVAMLNQVEAGAPWLPAAIEGLFVAPLTEAAAALLAAEWRVVRGRWTGADASFLAAVAEQGILHPTLFAWRLGLAD
jgi:hypothetical protein